MNVHDVIISFTSSLQGPDLQNLQFSRWAPLYILHLQHAHPGINPGMSVMFLHIIGAPRLVSDDNQDQRPQGQQLSHRKNCIPCHLPLISGLVS